MLTATDWLAVAGVVLPLTAKAFADWQAAASSRHNDALARITGMASRAAGTIARVLVEAPSMTNPRDLERKLVQSATEQVVQEMAGSVALIGGDSEKVKGIVQGELDKTITMPMAVPQLIERVTSQPAA